jgi:hypothetical protein
MVLDSGLRNASLAIGQAGGAEAFFGGQCPTAATWRTAFLGLDALPLLTCYSPMTVNKPFPSLSPAREVCALLALVGLLCSSRQSPGGPLEAYIDQPDSHYAWKQVEQKQEGAFTVTHLELTSQKWREHVWQHHLQVVRPDRVRHPGIAFLFITGDGRGTRQIDLLKTLAERAGALAAVVTRIPNQPLYDGRKEDALIAYTFDQYLKTGDETWPLCSRW